MTDRHLTALTLFAMMLSVRTVTAAGIDGQLDPGYGAALVTQTTQTGLSSGQIVGDNNQGDLNFANGSELDGAYALTSGGVLYLFLAGNVAMELNVNQNRTVGHALDIFVDAAPGGQNSLNGLGAGNPLNGLTFDVGFEADYWLELYGDAGGSHGPPFWIAGYAALSPGGGGSLVTLGTGAAGGPGTLTGGINPYGILATIDNRNVAGVPFGCDVASGAGVSTGVEWAIPLAALGNPAGCIKVTVIIRADPGGVQSPVSNQVLAPVPPGTCPLGPASSVNLATIAGNQFFTLCVTATDVPGESAPRLALLGTGPNPIRGDQVSVAFELRNARPATLLMIDCAGRVVRRRVVSVPGGGSGVADVSEGRPLGPGVYWLRLTQDGSSVARKLCIVR